MSPRTLFAVACCLVAVACSRTRGDEALGKTISAAAQEGARDVNVVDVPVLAAFEWDRLHVFPPYTSATTIQQELGFSWSEARRIEKHDDFVLLVFLNRGQVVRFVDLPRDGADFADAFRKGGFTHSDGLFRCTKGPESRRRCVMAVGS